MKAARQPGHFPFQTTKLLVLPWLVALPLVSPVRGDGAGYSAGACRGTWNASNPIRAASLQHRAEPREIDSYR
jgi:hypothetical protein